MKYIQDLCWKTWSEEITWKTYA